MTVICTTDSEVSSSHMSPSGLELAFIDKSIGHPDAVPAVESHHILGSTTYDNAT